MNTASYITIQAWMRTELELKGNDLLVYAIIYGFSQDTDSTFSGSLQYLADWCGCTKQGVIKNIKHLIDAGLIQKIEHEKNGKRYCEYAVTQVNGIKHSLIGIKHSLPNNITDKNISLSIIEDNTKRNTKSLTKSKNIYQKCVDEILLFNFPHELEVVVREYLSLRLKMTDKPIYSSKQWKAILIKLTDELAPNNVDMQIAIVKQSIERGYASVFPISKKKSSAKMRTYNDGVSCEQLTEEERVAARKWRKEMEKKGERVKF